MMRYLILSVAISANLLTFGQSQEKTPCFLAMDIPDRLIEISSDEKEVVFRDKKTNSILTFTKVGILDYEFDLDYTAENIVNELSEDPKFKNVDQKKMDLAHSEMILIHWTREDAIPSRANNCHSMALFDICNQYYTFQFSMPEKRKDDIIPMFIDILDSVEMTE